MKTWEDVQGWWGTNCHALIAGLLERLPADAHIVEVGAWRGRSAASIATHLRRLGTNARFDSVDTWKGTAPEGDMGYHAKLLRELAAKEPDGRFSLRADFEKNLRALHLWEYANPIGAPSDLGSALYEDASLDLVLIDADHRREQVANDVWHWWPKLRPGGILCGHDADAEAVLAGAQDGLSRHGAGEVPIHPRGQLWHATKPLCRRDEAKSLGIPFYPEGDPDERYGQYWLPWLFAGLRGSEVEVYSADDLYDASHHLPAGVDAMADRRGPRIPSHVAALAVDGRRVWLDFSDFTRCYAEQIGAIERGEPYLKIQLMRQDRSALVRPAGQHHTAPRDLEERLAYLRGHRDAVDASDAVGGEAPIWYCALFGNIDERWNFPLRRLLVQTLRTRLPGQGVAGLWRWNLLRPEVPPDLALPSMPRDEFWRVQRIAAASWALPGVGGELTRRHLEIMATGGHLCTVRSEQAMPGNFSRVACHIDPGAGAFEVEATDLCIVLATDWQERRRRSRLGTWYYERELAPHRFANRILEAYG